MNFTNLVINESFINQSNLLEVPIFSPLVASLNQFQGINKSFIYD